MASAAPDLPGNDTWILLAAKQPEQMLLETVRYNKDTWTLSINQK